MSREFVCPLGCAWCWCEDAAAGVNPAPLGTPNVCCWNKDATARCKSPLHVATRLVNRVDVEAEVIHLAQAG